jgi:hypothetical protein
MVFRSHKRLLVCFFVLFHHLSSPSPWPSSCGSSLSRVAKQAQTLLLLLLLLKGFVHAWACSCLLRGEQKEKVLMVGAGGIGCELLKTLVLTGFKHIHLVRFFVALLLYSLSLLHSPIPLVQQLLFCVYRHYNSSLQTLFCHKPSLLFVHLLQQ